MTYPDLHSEIVSIGPFALRWYGLAYLAGFLLAWGIAKWRARRLAGWDDLLISDLIFYCALGVIIGGRLGYVLFYGLDMALQDPLWVVKIWTGGMSFHGGLLGVIVALVLLARRADKRLLEVGDFVTPLAPPGLFFGRLANFVNTELPGRTTDVPWGLQYPCRAVAEMNPECVGLYENVLRHPSPLYQALAEGLVLGIVVWLFVRSPRPLGSVCGLFLAGYGAARLVTEMFRQPDVHIGFLTLGITMGQVLSVPMLLGGLALMWWGFNREAPPAARLLTANAAEPRI